LFLYLRSCNLVGSVTCAEVTRATAAGAEAQGDTVEEWAFFFPLSVAAWPRGRYGWDGDVLEAS
jgi:hypothetical protein